MKQIVIVLTDLHLFAEPECRLKMVPTRASFLDVLMQARQSVPNPNLVVLTGDLAHDELRETYVALMALLGDWSDRLCVIPGNHDCRDSIRSTVSPREGALSTLDGRCQFAERLGDWFLVGLDTHLPGELGGRLGTEQLAWLDGCLSANAERPTIVFTHHPPRPISSSWLDEMGLEDGEELCELLSRYPQVHAVVSGHVHQELDERDASRQESQLRYLTTPSTCIQFRPKSDEPAYDQSPPGFRIMELEGGEMTTRVIRLPALKYPSKREAG